MGIRTPPFLYCKDNRILRKIQRIAIKKYVTDMLVPLLYLHFLIVEYQRHLFLFF